MKYSYPPGRGKPINEGDCCPQWEPCQRVCLVTMRECWFCRWSGFDPDNRKHETQSICNYSKEEGEIKT